MQNSKTPPSSQRRAEKSPKSSRLSVGIILVLVALGVLVPSYFLLKKWENSTAATDVKTAANSRESSGKKSAAGVGKKEDGDKTKKTAKAGAKATNPITGAPRAVEHVGVSILSSGDGGGLTQFSAPIRISGERLAVTPASELATSPWKLREEKFRLSNSIRSIGDAVRAGSGLPAEMDFPTFDGGSLKLVDFEFRPQSLPNEGVFFAKVKGETNGGHVVLSYVNNALVGTIHSPSYGVFLEIRNATPQGGSMSDIFLAQLDPSKMPTCGVCNPQNSSNPIRPPVRPNGATPKSATGNGNAQH